MDNFEIHYIKIEKKIQSKDGTIKFLFQLFDGNKCEGVLIPDQNRLTACVSSQVGCSFSCAFSQFLSPKGRFPSVFRHFRPQRVVFLVFLLILRPRWTRGSSSIFSENLAWIFQPRSLDIFFFQKRYFSCLDAQGPLKPKTGLLIPAPKGRFPRVFRTCRARRVVFRCFSPCPAQKWRKT